MLAGDLADARSKIFALVVDRMIGAEGMAGDGFLDATDGDEHFAAGEFAELDGGKADATGAAVYQQTLAGLEFAQVNEVGPDGEPVLGQRGSFAQAETLGDRQGMAGGHCAEFGVTAAGRERGNFVTDFPFAYALAKCRDAA